MRAKRTSSSILLDLWACFLIPGYTLLFAGSVTWFGTNFSVRAVTGPEHYRGFLLWGALTGIYFLVMLVRLTATLPRGRLWSHALTAAACGCLILALPLPYVPAFLPGVAKAHVVLAFSACVLLMAALLVLLVRFSREDRARFRGCRSGWRLTVLGSGILFALSGMVSTALEVYFTICATLLTRRLWLVRKG